MNLVATVNVGPKYKALGEITGPFMQAYAKRIGADFVCVTETTYPKNKPYHEKYRLGSFLDRYERVLFLDVDVLVRRDAPSLFDLVPVGHWGALNEAAHSWWTVKAVQDKYKKFALPDDWSWDNLWYFNSGVMVFDRAHRAAFDSPVILDTPYWDQDWFNFAVRKLKFPTFFLPTDFNFMWPRMGKRTDSAYIIHFANAGRTGAEKEAYAAEVVKRWASS